MGRIEEGAYPDRSVDILGIDDALDFDDEEVEKLLDVVQASLQGRARDSPVLARPHLGRKTVFEDELAGNLKGGSD